VITPATAFSAIALIVLHVPIIDFLLNCILKNLILVNHL
jgi:hypothetical protein